MCLAPVVHEAFEVLEEQVLVLFQKPLDGVPVTGTEGGWGKALFKKAEGQGDPVLMTEDGGG